VAAGVLELTITRKHHALRDILRDLSLSLQAGEVVALKGPSGRGKTTVLQIAAGLDQDYQGQRILARGCRLAVIFQEPRLLPWRQTLDNILICKPPGGTASAQQALAAVGLSEAATLYPDQLSLGMQRRVAIARALATEPTVLIADEPLASLDAQTAQTIRRLIRDQADLRGCAVLMATHSKDDCAIADRAITLA
jgi:NitT/TauT family transport system ATP-binding protein